MMTRNLILASMFLLTLPACGSDAVVEGGGTDSGTDTEGSGGSGGSAGTGTVSTGSSTGMGSGSATGTSGTSTSGGFTTSGGSTTGGTSTGGTSTGGTSTGGGSGGSSGGSQACMQTHEILLEAKDATLSGDWMLAQSMFGEGEVAAVGNFGTDGSVLWEPDVPCADTWHIHVRYFDQGNNDSYFVQVDGEPNPEAIFEGDCTGMGNGYGWREMNWRDQGAGVCDYVEDPWTFAWDPGVHQVEFSYRESPAIARIVVTNDPNWAP